MEYEQIRPYQICNYQLSRLEKGFKTQKLCLLIYLFFYKKAGVNLFTNSESRVFDSWL